MEELTDWHLQILEAKNMVRKKKYYFDDFSRTAWKYSISEKKIGTKPYLGYLLIWSDL